MKFVQRHRKDCSGMVLVSEFLWSSFLKRGEHDLSSNDSVAACSLLIVTERLKLTDLKKGCVGGTELVLCTVNLYPKYGRQQRASTDFSSGDGGFYPVLSRLYIQLPGANSIRLCLF